MSGCPRRLRKKLHAKHLDRVILAALDSAVLAPQLRDLSPADSVDLVWPVPEDFPPSIRSAFARWSLRYRLALAAAGEVDDPYPVQGAVVFKLHACEFPNLSVFAEELPAQLGSSVGERAV